jgi:glyoxylase-like metal-dependent hydrolase (beta-lactamase superfamily II)
MPTNMPTNDGLAYEVFTAESLPMSVAEPLPNGGPDIFPPLSVTLIYGQRDAVLVDAPLTIDQGKAVGDWVEASGKKLTHIFATHGHGDHWFTAGMLAERFGAQVVASAGTIEVMHRNVAMREGYWDKTFRGIPPTAVTAVTVPDNHFSLEGHDLVIVEVGRSDTDKTSVLHVPDLGLVVAGDVIYNGVHQHVAESPNGRRDAWRRAINTVGALRPRWIVAGHKNRHLDDDAARVIGETRQYLDDVDDLLPKKGTAVDFFNAMVQRYPERLGQTTLWADASAFYAARGGDASKASSGG